MGQMIQPTRPHRPGLLLRFFNHYVILFFELGITMFCRIFLNINKVRTPCSISNQYFFNRDTQNQHDLCWTHDLCSETYFLFHFSQYMISVSQVRNTEITHVNLLFPYPFKFNKSISLTDSSSYFPRLST